VRTLFLLSFSILAAAASAQSASAPPPRLALMDANQLVFLKQKQAPEVLKAVRDEADRALHTPLLAVTGKPQTPPSGDKHDYMSLAPYFWPNPGTANGLPYIRHDGERNPQTAKIPDHQNLFLLEKSVHALALGYFLTGKEEYAARATLLLRTWFLDPASRMNPNLNFAQAVLGVNNGREEGVLEARGLPAIGDAIHLLAGSASWTKADQEGMTQWFTAYLAWLQTSKNGQQEAAAKNNHGSWFDEQLAGIAYFLGRNDLARQVVESARQRRIDGQIQADGKQPLELARTKSFSYSVFNLAALMQLAQIGDKVGVDLWTYRSPAGGSLQGALDYLLPYLTGKQEWTYKNLDGMRSGELEKPLLLAALHYRQPEYLSAARRMSSHPAAETAILEFTLSR
jgi:hypothetical protein